MFTYNFIVFSENFQQVISDISIKISENLKKSIEKNFNQYYNNFNKFLKLIVYKRRNII